MKDEKQMSNPGRFCWNELVTTDVPAAQAFYKDIFGWGTEKFEGVDEYLLIKKGGDTAGGMMQCPKHEGHARWISYVEVEDVDAIVFKTKKHGGKVAMDPKDIPTIGRIAVLIDPQGAAFAVIKPRMGA